MGAPKGNQNAAKGQRRQGLTMSLYIKADDYEHLQDLIEYADGSREKKVFLAHMNKVFDDAIGAEMRRLMAIYARDNLPRIEAEMREQG